MSVYRIDTETGRVTQVNRRIPREEAEALLYPRIEPPDDDVPTADDPGDEGKGIPPAAAHAADESGAEFNQRRRGLHSGRLGRWAGERVPVNG